jgi:hypothetical protein
LKGAGTNNEVLNDVMSNSLIYHRQTTDSLFKETLNNINETWAKAKLVITSPVNTVGCSYSPKAEPDFHNVFISAKPTCSPRDTFQTHMRVRHLKNNKMIFSLPTIQSLMCAKKRYELLFFALDQFENYNIAKKATLLHTIKEIKNEYLKNNIKCDNIDIIQSCYELPEDECPESLKNILYFNLFEDTISTKYYKEIFYEFLKRCGYQRDGIINECGEVYDTSFIDEIQYDNIEDIKVENINIVYNQIQSKTATETTKIRFLKYQFDKLCNPHIQAKGKFFETYLKSPFNEYIINSYTEFIGNVENEIINDKSNFGFCFELTKLKPVQLRYILELNTLLGLTYSYIRHQVITKENIDNTIEFLQKERKNLYTAFSLRDQSKNEVFNQKTAFQMIKRVYEKWNGTKFKGCDKDNHTKAYNTFLLDNDTDFCEGDINMFYKVNADDCLITDYE